VSVGRRGRAAFVAGTMSTSSSLPAASQACPAVRSASPLAFVSLESDVGYATAMPVSRRRKKKGRVVSTARRSMDVGGGGGDLAAAWANVREHQAKLSEARSAIASARAAAAVSEHLTDLAAAGTDAEFEDALCGWLGPWLLVADGARLEEQLDPNDAFDALIHAVAGRVTEVLDRWDTESDVGLRLWRVLAALAAIAPAPLDEHVAQVAAELRRGRRMLPSLPRGPRLAGDVLWARDVYGSRFGIVAPFHASGVTRWYLWDVDACGFEVFTVFSGYFADADQASDAWRAGVGEVAAGSVAFGPVDDTGLMDELLPADMGIMRIGGESEQQLSEYHRGMRLADTVRAGMRKSRKPPAEKLDPEAAAPLFATWLAEHLPDAQQPDDVDELLVEFMESWASGSGVAFSACSPHRVAARVASIRDYYDDEYSVRLVALLPDWVAFLSAYNGTPPDLMERCLPFASGASHPGVDHDNYQLRVTE
jgi:hypothetical protein